MTDFELSVLKSFLYISESALKRELPAILARYYTSSPLHVGQDYIYVEGDLPVTLVAHLDTVHPYPPTEEFLFHDSDKGVLWCPNGLGADDRAGVYAIFKLIERGYRPSIIFTTGEEIGGIGAFELVRNFETPCVNTYFMIELDRQGFKDSVYYNCGNRDFERYINSFGFTTDLGIFSDISIIAPKWGVAAVNLSVGYFNEHTCAEYLCYRGTLATIEKVSKILDNPDRKYLYMGKETLYEARRSSKGSGKKYDRSSLWA